MTRALLGIAFLGSLVLHGCVLQDGTAPDPASTDDTSTSTIDVISHNKVKDPPPTCNDSRYVDYDSTTTVQDNQLYQSCNGYDVRGSYITCHDYHYCTRTDVWHHSFTCMNNGEYYLEHTTLKSSSLSCDLAGYTDCPNPFFEEGACW